MTIDNALANPLEATKTRNEGLHVGWYLLDGLLLPDECAIHASPHAICVNSSCISDHWQTMSKFSQPVALLSSLLNLIPDLSK